jgi:hypothetical protein
MRKNQPAGRSDINRDPRYQWFLRRLREGKKLTPGIRWAMLTQLYETDLPATEPADMIGLRAVMLDKPAVEYIGSRVMDPAWLPRPSAPYYDKLSVRRSFKPEDEYLLMDGLSAFAHGHDDGSSFNRLTWHERIWLVDQDIIRHTPRYHNAVEIGREGRTGPTPPLAELSVSSDLGDIAFVRSELNDYNGLDWHRNVIWSKGRWFVAIDSLTANVTDAFDLNRDFPYR